MRSRRHSNRESLYVHQHSFVRVKAADPNSTYERSSNADLSLLYSCTFRGRRYSRMASTGGSLRISSTLGVLALICCIICSLCEYAVAFDEEGDKDEVEESGGAVGLLQVAQGGV
jgi:hypothetical protein